MVHSQTQQIEEQNALFTRQQTLCKQLTHPHVKTEGSSQDFTLLKMTKGDDPKTFLETFDVARCPVNRTAPSSLPSII